MSVEVRLRSGVSAKLDAIPSNISRLAFISAFLDAREMRRLFTSNAARAVADEIGLEVRNEPEAETCRRIEAHWKAPQGDSA